MRVDGNQGGATPYQPNSYDEWVEQPDFREPPLAIEGAADHWNHRSDDDYYSQPRLLFQLMTPEQQTLLFDNTARAIDGASAEVVARHIENCTKCDPAYGAGVTQAIARQRQQR
jgi:catalase